jgi:hypothetical protein
VGGQGIDGTLARNSTVAGPDQCDYGSGDQSDASATLDNFASVITDGVPLRHEQLSRRVETQVSVQRAVGSDCGGGDADAVDEGWEQEESVYTRPAVIRVRRNGHNNKTIVQRQNEQRQQETSNYPRITRLRGPGAWSVSYVLAGGRTTV